MACAYFLLIVYRAPYKRDADERLHLLAQVNIFLFLLAAYVFLGGETLDSTSDALM